MKLYNFVKSNIINGEYIYEPISFQTFKKVFPENFLEGINTIDNIFYDYISKKYLINKDEIDDILGKYEFRKYIDLFNHYSEFFYKENFTKSELIKNEYLINRYPLITEISFCISSNYYNTIYFDEACGKKLKLD